MPDLANQYRPTKFEEVIGQDRVIKALKAYLDRNSELPPCILFSGGPGLGKTTLARICASAVASENVFPIDAGLYGGVETIREITRQSAFQTMRGGPRVFIIDEAHMLSKNALAGLLKPTEEPGESTRFILCTTEPKEIPSNIRSRCEHYKLVPVAAELIQRRLKEVAVKEDFGLADEGLAYIANLA